MEKHIKAHLVFEMLDEICWELEGLMEENLGIQKELECAHADLYDALTSLNKKYELKIFKDEN